MSDQDQKSINIEIDGNISVNIKSYTNTDFYNILKSERDRFYVISANIETLNNERILIMNELEELYNKGLKDSRQDEIYEKFRPYENKFKSLTEEIYNLQKEQRDIINNMENMQSQVLKISGSRDTKAIADFRSDHKRKSKFGLFQKLCKVFKKK